jgi:hypothetical protein
MKFPKTLYMRTEDDGNAHYFIAAEDLDDHAVIGEKVKVGIYELVETVRLTTLLETSTVKS